MSNILIVDDEEFSREILSDLLSPEGHDITLAENGEEALKKAREVMPDVMLLDVMMPGMSGFDLCRRVRSDPLLEEVPILLVSSLDDKESRLEGINAGADDFINKPFDRIEMRARIRTITRLNRYRRILESEEKLVRLANYDTLTDLPNYNLFRERVQQALTWALRQDKQVAVLLINLDRFQKINMGLGNAYGDYVLQQVAVRLGDRLHQGDTLARIDRDQFGVLSVFDRVGARGRAPGHYAQEMLDAVMQPMFYKEHELTVTACIGVAFFPDDAANSADLLKNAETALFESKQRGTNHYGFFAKETDASLRDSLLLENQLRKGLERNELEVFYQPQADLKTGVCCGVEALVRWRHPKLGILPPVKFVPLAEESDLIVSLGEQVLYLACKQAKQWQDSGYANIRMAVNMSSRQFRHEHLIQAVQKVLDETGLDPACLELELTESLLIQEGQESHYAVLNMLNFFKSMGMSIAIDDFGTGYSSLSYLKRFPVDVLKIDQSFMSDLHVDSNSAALVSTIIAMAQNLSMEVIAEGVETVGQLKFLLEKCCSQAQGYLFSRPLPAKEVAKYFGRNIVADVYPGVKK